MSDRTRLRHKLWRRIDTATTVWSALEQATSMHGLEERRLMLKALFDTLKALFDTLENSERDALQEVVRRLERIAKFEATNIRSFDK